jgi:hypothetical protein
VRRSDPGAFGEEADTARPIAFGVLDPKQASISPVTGLAMQAKPSIDFRGY